MSSSTGGGVVKASPGSMILHTGIKEEVKQMSYEGLGIPPSGWVQLMNKVVDYSWSDGKVGGGGTALLLGVAAHYYQQSPRQMSYPVMVFANPYNRIDQFALKFEWMLDIRLHSGPIPRAT
jgi:hypothetical protein